MPTIESLEGKTVCVVDAYGLLYQVFHAPGMEMTNSHGEPTGAVFGFVRDILSIMNKLRPDYLFCAYDMHAKTFRSDLYPSYKAKRSATPDDLLLQFDFTREFLKAIGVPSIGVVGYEADDVMATFAKRIESLNGKTILATADKDARQLLSSKTIIYLLRKEKYYDIPDLMKDWGIRPDQVVDFQSLVGDSSDNVPGVPLIGPKVAGELLAKYDTLEGVIAGAIGQKGKRFENIRNNNDLAFLSRKLVKLRDDVPFEIDWNKGKLGGIDPERLRRLFQYWNFRSFVSKVDDLANKFGIANAEHSDWFDKIESERRDFLEISTNNDSKTSGTLFDIPDANGNAKDQTSCPQGAVDFAANIPLLARFGISQYGANPKRSPNQDAKTNLDDFELVSSQNFPTLNSIPLPQDHVARKDWTSIVVNNKELLAELRDKLGSAQWLAIACVTQEASEIGRVRPRFASLCGLSLAFEPDKAYYIPFRVPLGESALEFDATLDTLKPFLESNKLAKIGFELKYDALVLLDNGIQLHGLAFDVSLADYLIRSGDTRRTLSDVAQAYLDASLFDIRRALGIGKKRTSLDMLPLPIVAEYAADSVLVPLNSAPILRAKLTEVGAFERLVIELETPIVETLAEMEYNGIAITPKRFKEASAQFLEKQRKLENEIRALIANVDPEPDFADKINFNSPKQLQRLLFDDLKLRVLRKTKTGSSVDAEVLEELANEHPVPEKIVELRKLTKLRGTYLEPLPNETLGTSNRICATFNQSATATGRLSSSDPNLQNIPTRSEDGKFIRAGFVPDQSLGFDVFLSCDYSQIELRVLAHFSGDAELKRSFELNQDIHTAVASKIFQVKPEEVTSDMRRKAKAVNFGLVYGQTSFGLSKSLGISQGEATAYIDAFFSTYPSVLNFFDRVLEDCSKLGYVQTALGRRRALTGVRGPRGRKTLNFPERAAINAVVQGTAADIMKLAMIAVWSRLKREGWVTSHWSRDAIARKPSFQDGDFADFSKTPLFSAFEPQTSAVNNERARLLLQIHDELLFETRQKDVEELTKIVVQEMQLNDPLSVPLKVDAEIGSNWGEL